MLVHGAGPRIRVVASIGSQLVAPALAAPVLSIGAHTVANNTQGSGVWPLVTSSVTTQASGSTLLLFVGLPGGSAVAAVSDNKSNTYTQVGTTQTYASLGGTWTVWACTGATGGSGHTFSLQTVPPSSATGGPEGVIFAVEVKGAVTSVQTFSFAEPTVNPIPATNVTTSAAGAMLLMYALGDSTGSPDTYSPSAGYTQIDQQTNGGNSMAGGVAFQVAGAAGSYGGSYTSSLTPSSGSQSGIALVAVR